MIQLHRKLGGTTFLKKVVPVVLLEFLIQDWILRKSGSLNFIKSTTFMQKWYRLFVVQVREKQFSTTSTTFLSIKAQKFFLYISLHFSLYLFPVIISVKKRGKWHFFSKKGLKKKWYPWYHALKPLIFRFCFYVYFYAFYLHILYIFREHQMGQMRKGIPLLRDAFVLR